MKPPQKNQIICGSNLEVVKSWPPNCISAVLTDPPYGLGFMGKDWDTFNPEHIKKVLHQDSPEYGPRGRKTKHLGQDGSYRHRGCGKASEAGLYDHSRNPEFQQWFTVWAKAMLRITKPGGFLLCFGGTRTYHRLACAIEDAGWEIRDCMMWLYGSGFPKSHNISKAIDKAAGAKRKVIGTHPNPAGNKAGGNSLNMSAIGMPETADITASSTDLAQLWDGYGTALKPAWEPIIVAMKPLDGTFAHNAEAHGVAGLNIDGGRIGSNPGYKYNADKNGTTFHGQQGERIKQTAEKKGDQFIESTQGRWPANLVLTHHPDCWVNEAGKISCQLDCPVRLLDEQTQNVGNTKPHKVKSNIDKYDGYGSITRKQGEVVNYSEPNTKGASRFFYCAKTSRKERNMGCGDLPEKTKVWNGQSEKSSKDIKPVEQRWTTKMRNTHPTVKPLALMKYLCTLLKMPSADQIILDPFLGSGTTGIACKELGIDFIGIEKEPEYCEIAVKRIAAIEGTEITLHTDNSPAEEPKAIPCHDEHRQSIINAASAVLRRKKDGF